MNQSEMKQYGTEALNVEVSELYPADWNYKSDDVPESVRTKFKNSILQDRSAGVLAVREVDGRDGYEVMDGNHRLDILRELGTGGIPVENFGKISEAEAITIAARRNHEWYPADPLKWADALSNTVLKEFSFEALDEFMPQTRDILEQAADLLDRDLSIEDDDFDVEAALEVEPVSKHGDLWHLGEHRLLCGDSTVKEDVERVMNGETMQLFVTDPPYGVGYAKKNQYLNKADKGNKIQTPIENDDLDLDDMCELWRKVFTLAHEFASDGCAYYVNAPQGGDLMMMMMMMIRDSGWLLKPQIIWVKNNHVLGMSDYQLKHEPILYGWREGGAHRFYGDRSQMSVWEVDKPLKNEFHPTMKPLDLVRMPLLNSSQTGEIIGDFFLGSGTTLIACEQLSRRCFAIEIAPQYIDVAVKRYVQAVGVSEEIFCERNGKRISYNEMFRDTE